MRHMQWRGVRWTTSIGKSQQRPTDNENDPATLPKLEFGSEFLTSSKWDRRDRWLKTHRILYRRIIIVYTLCNQSNPSGCGDSATSVRILTPFEREILVFIYFGWVFFEFRPVRFYAAWVTWIRKNGNPPSQVGLLPRNRVQSIRSGTRRTRHPPNGFRRTGGCRPRATLPVRFENRHNGPASQQSITGDDCDDDFDDGPGLPKTVAARARPAFEIVTPPLLSRSWPEI